MEDVLAEPPCANALLIAERVYRDSTTRSWIIAGVFNHIAGQKLPVVQDRFDVFFQVTNVSRPVDLRLHIEHTEGDVLMDLGGPISSESPLEVIEKRVIVRGAVFKKLGKHFVQLMSREQVLTAAPLYVTVTGEEAPHGDPDPKLSGDRDDE